MKKPSDVKASLLASHRLASPNPSDVNVDPAAAASSSSSYRLRRYSWRTSLTFTGPILLIGFYAFISFYYLNQPPVNAIVPSNGVDARWSYYAWFIISIFTLEWARSGLANVEAAAIMRPALAPDTAMELMWHADANWSNVLWWLRGLRNLFLGRLAGRLASNRRSVLASRPGGLWWFLSGASFLLFIAIPLSGLTMELTTVSVPCTEKAMIRGSHPKGFNWKGMIDLPKITRGKWTAGGATTPSDASIIYALHGKANVSTRYYEEEIVASNDSTTIQVFVGPAVDRPVAGNAWGLESSINCRQVPQDELQLIQVHGWNDYSVLLDPTDESFLNVNETGIFSDITSYSLVVAADGVTEGRSPYSDASNHDASTLDGMRSATPQDRPTTALFEAYLWQGFNTVNDSTMDTLLTATTQNIAHVQNHRIDDDTSISLAGFAIQCRIQSAVGNATLSPAHRTYSGFTRGTSAQSRGLTISSWLPLVRDLYPVQIQALEAIGNHDEKNYHLLTPYNASGSESTWLAMHLAIGSLPYTNRSEADPQDPADAVFVMQAIYPALTPQNLTLALYKLLGESMIAMMGPGAQDPWEGDLYTLATTYYLRPGVVPWKVVLVLLVIWALIMVSTSTWMAFTRRWAPSLVGFEFFKFGAEYGMEVHAFDDRRFERCGPLKEIPGMVGNLPREGSMQDRVGSEGFVGLSKNVATWKGRFVFDRERAGKG